MSVGRINFQSLIFGPDDANMFVVGVAFGALTYSVLQCSFVSLQKPAKTKNTHNIKQLCTTSFLWKTSLLHFLGCWSPILSVGPSRISLCSWRLGRSVALGVESFEDKERHPIAA